MKRKRESENQCLHNEKSDDDVDLLNPVDFRKVILDVA